MDDNNPIPAPTAAAPLKLSQIFLKLGSNAGQTRSLSQFALASNLWNPLIPGIGSNCKASRFVGTRLPDISGTITTAPMTFAGATYAFSTAAGFGNGGAVPIIVTYGSNLATNALVVTEATTPASATAFGATMCNVTLAGTTYPTLPQTATTAKLGGTAATLRGVTLTPTITVLKRNNKTKTNQACVPLTVADGTGTTTVSAALGYGSSRTTNYATNATGTNYTYVPSTYNQENMYNVYVTYTYRLQKWTNGTKAVRQTWYDPGGNMPALQNHPNIYAVTLSFGNSGYVAQLYRLSSTITTSSWYYLARNMIAFNYQYTNAYTYPSGTNYYTYNYTTVSYNVNGNTYSPIVPVNFTWNTYRGNNPGNATGILTVGNTSRSTSINFPNSYTTYG